MKLCLDIGNNRIKAGWFDRDPLAPAETLTLEGDLHSVLDTLEQTGRIRPGLCCSVRPLGEDIRDRLDSMHIAVLDHRTTLPFPNHYKTPETLGKDRLAAVAGAYAIAPASSALIIDAGTCVTYDLLDVGQGYLGGNIAPGMYMRLQAMHEYTAALPLAKPAEEIVELGTDTISALQAGAQTGLCMEINAFIGFYQNKYPGLNIFLTGGDASYLCSHCVQGARYEPYLVLIGLNEIYSHQ